MSSNQDKVAALRPQKPSDTGESRWSMTNNCSSDAAETNKSPERRPLPHVPVQLDTWKDADDRDHTHEQRALGMTTRPRNAIDFLNSWSERFEQNRSAANPQHHHYRAGPPHSTPAGLLPDSSGPALQEKKEV